MKKKIAFVATVLLITIIGVLFLSTGGRITSVSLTSYSISEENDQLALKVSVASSVGYIRTLKTSEDGNKKQITFYSTYGLNSRIGAKDEFQVKIHPSCDEIYFYSGNGVYELKLKKNNGTNEWERANRDMIIKQNKH